MVKMKNCRHLWPRHDIPLSKAWRGERPRPPVPQLALPPAAIIGARRSSLAASAADEAAAACDPADAAAAVPVTSLKCVAAIGRQSVTEEQAPRQVSRDTTSYEGPRTYRQSEK